MTPKEFDKMANELFSTVLSPFGFSNKGSKYCTFYRMTGDNIYHMIVPDPGTRGAWYDVKIFPTCPLLEPRFKARFPDDLPCPNDSWCYLNTHGIGMEQQQFNSKSAENFQRRFDRTVKDLLLNVAIPFLDGLQSLPDLIPIIRSKLHLGLALFHIGRRDEARNILEGEKIRLSNADASNEDVCAYLKTIDSILLS